MTILVPLWKQENNTSTDDNYFVILVNALLESGNIVIVDFVTIEVML